MKKKKPAFAIELLVVCAALAAAATAAKLPPRPSGPAVEVVSPKKGDVLSGLVTIAASAGGSAAVQIEVDGTPIAAAMTAPPYTAVWDTRKLGDGDHTVTAIALDQAGARAVSAPMHVMVMNAKSGR